MSIPFSDERPLESAEESSAEVAVVEDELCVEIDQLFDSLLTTDFAGSQLLSTSDIDRHLPPELTIVEGRSLPQSARLENMEAIDAHTMDRCGVPYLRALMFASAACIEFPEGEALPFDWGPCFDPRTNVEALPPAAVMLDDVDELGRQVREEFEAIDSALRADPAEDDPYSGVAEVAAYDAFVIETFAGVAAASELHGIQILINGHCLDLLGETGLEATFGPEVEEIIESFDQQVCDDVVRSPLFVQSPASGLATWEEMITDRFSRVEGWSTEAEFSARAIVACLRDQQLLDLQEDASLSLSAMVELNGILSTGDCALIQNGEQPTGEEIPSTTAPDYDAFRAAIEEISYPSEVTLRPADIRHFDLMIEEHIEFGYALNLGVVWVDPQEPPQLPPIDLANLVHDALIEAGFDRTRVCAEEDDLAWEYHHPGGATGPVLVAPSSLPPEEVYIAITGAAEANDRFDSFFKYC